MSNTIPETASIVRLFLMASPGKEGLLHDGTMVLEFEDISAARLKRSGGELRPVLHLRPQADFLSVRGGGQADYDEHNTAGGILFPQVNLSAYPEIRQVFRTRRRIVGP